VGDVTSQELRIRYTGDARGVSSTLKSLERQHASFGSKLGNAGRAIGRGVSTGVRIGTAALIGFGAVGVKTAAEFDTTFRTMEAVAGVTGKGLQQLQDLAIEQGKNTVFSANEAAEAELELAKAGVSASDILGGALKQSLSLASAGNIDLASSATITANAMNVFGLRGNQAQVAVDALGGAANASSADVDDIAQALSQAGNAAASAGLSVSDTTAVLASFADAGIKGSDAGTSLKTFLLSLVPTSVAAKGAIKKLGLEFVDAQGNIRPINSIAEELSTKLGGLTQAEQQLALKTIFGTDAFRAANVIMKQGDEGLASYQEATTKVGNAQETAAARMGGFAGMLESIKGSIETVALGLGQKLLPVLSDLFTSLTPIINALGPVAAGLAEAFVPVIAILGTGLQPLFAALTDTFAIMAPALADVATAGVELLVTLIPFIPILGEVVALFARGLVPVLEILQPVLPAIVAGLLAFKAVVTVISIVKGLVVAWKLLQVAFMTSPWGFIIAGLVVLGVLIVQHWDTIKGFLLKAWDTIKNVAGSVWHAIWGVIATPVKAIWAVVRTVIGVLVGWWKVQWKVVSTVARVAWGVIRTVVKAGASVVLGIFDWLRDKVLAVWDFLRDHVIDKVVWIKDRVIGAFQVVRDRVVGAWTWIKDKVWAVINWIAEKVAWVTEKLRSLMELLGGGVAAGGVRDLLNDPDVQDLLDGMARTPTGGTTGSGTSSSDVLGGGAGRVATNGGRDAHVHVHIDRRRFGRAMEHELLTRGS
jgi:TP901 family phage tail tape measure protein